jgi:hypothetical protein
VPAPVIDLICRSISTANGESGTACGSGVEHLAWLLFRSSTGMIDAKCRPQLFP